jgi:hypothetical protein
MAAPTSSLQTLAVGFKFQALSLAFTGLSLVLLMAVTIAAIIFFRSTSLVAKHAYLKAVRDDALPVLRAPWTDQPGQPANDPQANQEGEDKLEVALDR